MTPAPHKLIALAPLLVGLWLASSGAASAQSSSQVRSSVEPMLEGWFDEGEWMGAVVLLSNDGPDTNVVVTVTTGGGSTTYEIPVELPQGARKRVPFYCRPWYEQLNVFVRGSGGVDATHSVGIRPTHGSELVLVVSDTGVRLNGLDVGTGGSGIRRIDVKPKDLPEESLALGSVDKIVALETELGVLSEAQAEALHQWVALGGYLVLGGGVGAAGVVDAVPEPLRIADVSGVSEASGLGNLARLLEFEVPDGPVLLADLEPHDGVDVLAATSEGQPVLLRRYVGAGQVVALAFDPSAPPISGWSGAHGLWSTLANDKQAALWGTPRPSRSAVALSISSLPQFGLPSAGWTVMLVGVYILLVGPANYVFLHRRRRLDLAWATIPALTLAAAVATYGVGYWLHGGELIIYELSTVRVVPGEDVAYVQTFVGLYSPVSRSYSAEVSDGFALAAADAGGVGGFQSIGDVTALQGRVAGIRDLEIAQWSLGAFAVEGVVPWSAGPAGRLTADAETVNYARGVSGEVSNPFGRRVADAQLLVGAGSTRLGDMDPGQRQEVELALRTGELWAEVDRSRMLGSYSDSDGAALRSGLLMAVFEPEEADSYMYSGGYYGGGPYTGSAVSTFADDVLSRLPAVQGAYLFGWTDEAPLQVDIHGSRGRRITHTLLYAQVPLHGASMITGYVPGEVKGADGTSTECLGQPVVLGSGEVEVVVVFPYRGDPASDGQLWVALVGEQIGRTNLEARIWQRFANEWMPLGNIYADDGDDTPGIIALGAGYGEDVRLRLVRDPTDTGPGAGAPVCGELRLFARPPTQRDLG